ncbi:papain family cysteine protease [Cooperia oncophora]
MRFLVVAALVFAIASATYVPPSKRILREAELLTGLDLIEYVNKAQNLFTAELSPRFAQYPEEVKKRLMGVKHVAIPEVLRGNEKTHDDIADASIPDSFDARTNWPQCPSISSIRDQSSCGSCWAFGAAEAMTDRICIASNGKEQFTISADDILSCCGLICGNGCEGGYPLEAWKFWVKHGVVTGGNYTSKAGCKPYPFPPCEHHNNATHYKPCPSDLEPTNKCEKSCQAGYSTSYTNDKHFGATAYAVSKKVTDIQKEIMTNGPVEVSFNVYEDFEHYTGGIYVAKERSNRLIRVHFSANLSLPQAHLPGSLLGGHAVKMIGWGTENGTPYWICSNSWNSDWGEKGFFRIVRGLDECGIESGVVGGEPKL